MMRTGLKGVRLSALLALTIVMLAPTTALAAWVRAESPRFVVYAEGDQATARRYAEKLEIFDSLLRHLHGMNTLGVPPRKLDVYLVHEGKDLREVRPGLSTAIAGFYHATPGDIYIMAVREAESDWILMHEYTHHFMMQNYPYAYPAWVVEGYAEYFQTADIDDRRVQVGLANDVRGHELVEDRWLPLDLVLSKRGSELEPGQRGLFYGQAWALTHYFMSDPQRYSQLLAYLDAVGKGGDPVRAMRDATGLETPALQKAVRTYITGRIPYRTYEIDKLPRPEVTVTVLPQVWDDLLLPYLRMRSWMDKDEGAAFVRDVVRKRAGKHKGERMADLALAYGEIWFGDRLAGEAIAQRLLAEDARDGEALKLLGISRYLDAIAKPEQAVAYNQDAGRMLARSYAARPDDYRTLFYYVLSREAQPGLANDNTFAAAARAYDLAPQVYAVRSLYADALIARKDWKGARAVLLQMANDPHGGQGAERARQRLQRIDEAIAAEAKPAGAP